MQSQLNSSNRAEMYPEAVAKDAVVPNSIALPHLPIVGSHIVALHFGQLHRHQAWAHTAP